MMNKSNLYANVRKNGRYGSQRQPEPFEISLHDKPFQIMKGIFQVVLLMIAMFSAACGKTNQIHVLENTGFTIPYSFKGYVVDNGYGNWVYFLDGESNGIKINHDASLMIPDNIFGCPVEMNVVSNEGKIEYSMPIDAEAIYSKQEAENCVTNYSLIFQKLVSESVKNINSYSTQ